MTRFERHRRNFEIIRLYVLEEIPGTRVAERVGLSHRQVYEILRQQGVKSRPRKPRARCYLCGLKARAHRMCEAHLSRWKRGGDPGRPERLRPRRISAGAICCDCGEAPVACMDRCNPCYRRWKYRTDPGVRLRAKLNSRRQKLKRRGAAPASPPTA